MAVSLLSVSSPLQLEFSLRVCMGQSIPVISDTSTVPLHSGTELSLAEIFPAGNSSVGTNTHKCC